MRLLNSHPETYTKAKFSDALIGRTVIEKKLSITETESYSQSKTVGDKTVSSNVRHNLTFVDDGRKLTVTDSTNTMSNDFFLSGIEQGYEINKKTGAMKVLEPKASTLSL